MSLPAARQEQVQGWTLLERTRLRCMQTRLARAPNVTTRTPGLEISLADFRALMNDHDDVPSEFVYPQGGLFRVKDMLSVDEFYNPNSKNLEGERVRRVIKRGSTTLTTGGCRHFN